MSAAALRFEAASCTLSGVRIVEALDLTLEAGQILTLLGPSGSGKTTMLRMAVGLERCTSGRVLYQEIPVDAPADGVFVPPERRNIAMVFQSYAIWPHMTVFGNVAFPLTLRKRPKTEVRQKVLEALALVGLEQQADRPATQLSGGQQQRVAIARAVVSTPSVLLADEPFSNLDAQLREQMRADLKALQRKLGFSVLFVTHDQSEALALSDQLAVVRAGRIEQRGTPLELYARPQTPFVRDFIGRWLQVKSRIAQRDGSGLVVTTGEGRRVHVTGPDFSDGAPADAKTLLTIRPEDVAITPDVAAGLQPNTIVATIETLLFLGQTFEASIILADGERVLMTLPANQAWREQQQIQLHLPADRLQLWPRT